MSKLRRFVQVVSSTIIILSLGISTTHSTSVSAQAGDGLKRQLNPQTGKVSFIGPENGRSVSAAKALGISSFARPADPALALAKRFAPEFGLNNPARDLSVKESDHHETGRLTVRYQQNYQGIPVMGGELMVNTNENGDLYSMNGEVSSNLSLSTEPAVTAEQAKQTALQAAAKWYQKTPEDLLVSEPELWIFDESLLLASSRPAELVWCMEVTSVDDLLPVRELVLINAQRGNISLHFNQVDTAWATNLAEKSRTIVRLSGSNVVRSSQSLQASIWPVYFDLVLDETRGWLYGSDSTGNKVDVISTTTLQLIKSFTLASGANPKGIALSPSGSELVIAQSGAGSLLFINPDTGSTIATLIPSVPVGHPNIPWDVVYGRSGRLYSSGNPDSSGLDYIHVINTNTHLEINKSSEVIRAAPRLAISSNYNFLYTNQATFSPNKLYEFNVTTDTPTLTKSTPHSSGFQATTFTLWQDNKVITDRGQVWSTDLNQKLGWSSISKDGQLAPKGSSAGLPSKNAVAMALDFSSGGDEVIFIEMNTYYPISRLTFSGTLGAIVATTNGNTLFLSSSLGVQKVDLTSFPVGTPVEKPAGSLAYRELVLDNSRGVAYGSNSSGHKIDIISLNTMNVLDEIVLADGAIPTGISLRSDGNELTVAQSGLGSIAFIDLESNTVLTTFSPVWEAGDLLEMSDVIYGRPGRLYYASDVLGTINTTTHTQIGVSSYLNGIGGSNKLEISSDNNRIYVSTLYSPNNIHIFNVSSDTPTFLNMGPHGPVMSKIFTVLPNESKIFANEQVWSSNMQTMLGTFQIDLPISYSNTSIQYLPGHNALAIGANTANADNDFLYFIDATTYELLSVYFIRLAKIGDIKYLSESNDLLVSSTEGLTTVNLSSFPPGETSFGTTRRTYSAYNGSYLPGTHLCSNQYLFCTFGANDDADQAHFHAGLIWKFYNENHSRNSIDNSGMDIISTVNYNYNYDNAFWSGTQMVYGDGAGFVNADDVVAHELTHGVTQHESNLFSYYQSGAINESFSDLWGEYYDQTNGQGNDAAGVKWLLGEDTTGLGAIRNMSNPPAYGDPDKISSTYYYEGQDDNGGVHSNSGVNNKAVFLMVDGGTFNGKTVTGLGWDKTAAIYYEVNTNLLFSGADYSDLYFALRQACLNMIGQKGISSSDCIEVKDAIDAVEMNAQPASNFNTDAPFCNTGITPSIIFADDLESGTAKWSFNNGAYTRWQYDSPYGPYAHSGLHSIYADDYPAAITDAAARFTSVTVPSNAYLHFAHAYDFEAYLPSPGPAYFDGGVVEYSIDGGSTWQDAGSLMDFNGYRGIIYSNWNNPLRGRWAFIGSSHGYISTRLNLASLAGKNVIFRWRMGLDDSGMAWGWWLDDIKVYNCVSHSISGNVGVAGVSLNYTDGAPKAVNSSGNGSYSLPISNSWSGTVTPFHPCFTFSPSVRNYNSVITNQNGQNYTPAFNSGSGCADISVLIAGANQGRLGIPGRTSTRIDFPSIDNGPVKVVSANSTNILAALRVIWKEPGFRASYSEMMGLPTEQLSTEYWFPWYNNAAPNSMDQGFRIGNVNASSTAIQVWVGTTLLDSFSLNPGASVRVGYPVDNGPIRILCTDCSGSEKIIAAMRVIWKEPGVRFSYSEMMGLSKEQLSSEYWFPWYNNAVPNSMDQGFRIANVSSNDTNTVEVWVGSTKLDIISLAAGASIRKGYNVDNGPIRIVCTTCTNTGDDKIIAALRVIWKEPGFRASYSEMMGLPNEQLSTEYWFPWYNNAVPTSMDQGFRIANISMTESNTVEVWVGTTKLDTLIFEAGASIRKGYNVDNGPIRIVCTTCTNTNYDQILAALRVIWKEPGFRASYSEMMGLPAQALSTEYWFPWYNFAAPNSMDQGFRIAVP